MIFNATNLTSKKKDSRFKTQNLCQSFANYYVDIFTCFYQNIEFFYFRNVFSFDLIQLSYHCKLYFLKTSAEFNKRLNI